MKPTPPPAPAGIGIKWELNHGSRTTRHCGETGQFAVDSKIGTKTLNCKYNHDDGDVAENVFALTCSWTTALGKSVVLAKLRFGVRDIDDDAHDDDDSTGSPSGTCSYADSGNGATGSCCIANIAPTPPTPPTPAPASVQVSWVSPRITDDQGDIDCYSKTGVATLKPDGKKVNVNTCTTYTRWKTFCTLTENSELRLTITCESGGSVGCGSCESEPCKGSLVTTGCSVQRGDDKSKVSVRFISIVNEGSSSYNYSSFAICLSMVCNSPPALVVCIFSAASLLPPRPLCHILAPRPLLRLRPTTTTTTPPVPDTYET